MTHSLRCQKLPGDQILHFWLLHLRPVCMAPQCKIHHAERQLIIATIMDGNNIVGPFDVLPNFPFTTSETKPDY